MRVRGWVLVGLLGLLACSCDRQLARTGEGVPAPAAHADLVDLLPAGDEVRGWARAGEVERFGAGNLWEYIDGAAESFLEYGFQELVTVEYAPAGTGESVVVDIYRMADNVGAFGVYRHELPAEPVPADLGVEAHAAGNTMRFWAGSCYVKLTGAGASEELRRGMEDLAGALSRRIGDPGGLPHQVAFFPTEGLLPASLRLVPADVLSQSSLRDGFEAEYRIAGDEGKLVIVEFPDVAAAIGAVGELEGFVGSSGEPVARVADLANGGFAGRDGFYGSVLAVRAGSRMVVTVGFASPAAARRLLEACLQRIAVAGASSSLKG